MKFAYKFQTMAKFPLASFFYNYFYITVRGIVHVRCMWTIGPLQPAIHVVQNCHAGEQVALGQDKQKIHNFKW